MDKNENRKLLIILFYVALAGIFMYMKNNTADTNKANFVANNLASTEIASSDEPAEVTPEKIYIHLSGEVRYPGLITVESGSRLFEAVEIAGGLSDIADIDQINLAMKLHDEDKIYIPKKGENAQIYSNDKKSDIVNINTGSKEELMTLPGIGEKTAESIMEYRSANRFNKIEDIMNVPGIGEGKFKQIESRITI